MNSASAFAPASVSNVNCGFDILGFAIAGPGDVVTARLSSRPGVVIEAISGDSGHLPREAGLNTASIAARALLVLLDATDRGLALTVEKRMPLASGLGSSAASSVAAVLAANEVLAGGLSDDDLLLCALEGETAASGAVHADNVAPCLLGGLVLVRSLSPPDLISLPIPAGLSCAILRPRIAIRTSESRALLGESIPLRNAITQWANVGGLIAGLYREDWGLLRRSLVDVVAEPIRAPLIPGFEAVRAAAMAAGALSCGLSGSGPAMFALCQELSLAEGVALAMQETFAAEVGIDSQHYVSAVGARGAHIVSADETTPEQCGS